MCWGVGVGVMGLGVNVLRCSGVNVLRCSGVNVLMCSGVNCVRVG